MLLLLLNILSLIIFNNLRVAYNWNTCSRRDAIYKSSVIASLVLNIGSLVCVHVSFLFSVKRLLQLLFVFLAALDLQFNQWS